MREKFATHVLRLLFKMLSSGNSFLDKFDALRTFNDDCVAALCGGKIGDLHRMLLDPSSSACIQVLLEHASAEKKKELLDAMFYQSVTSSEEKDKRERWINKLINDKIGSRTFETCIKVINHLLKYRRY